VAPYVADALIGKRSGVRRLKPTEVVPRVNERSNDVPRVVVAPIVAVRLEASPRLVHEADQSTKANARVADADVDHAGARPTPRTAAALAPIL
jgi:hypothetical protein